MVTDEIRGRVYGALAVAEGFGIMGGEPLLQSIFAAVLGLPTFWLGAPFFASAVSCAISKRKHDLC